MSDFDRFPTDAPAIFPAPPTMGDLPYVEIHAEGDVETEAEIPYEETEHTVHIGVADDLEVTASEPAGTNPIGRVTLAAEANDPRRRPVSMPIPAPTEGDTDDTEHIPETANAAAPEFDHYDDGESFENTIPLPSNIEGLLDEATPADMRQGVTPKLDVPGHPELIARKEEGISYENIKAAKRDADALLEHGVKVLPSRPLEHDDTMYIITQRVEGQPLEEAITAGATPQLLSQIDRTWTGLAKGLQSALEGGERFPSDIVGPQQYMVGTTSTDPSVDVRMVDHPNGTNHVDRFDYETELFDITRTVVHMERVTHLGLDGARAAIGQALTHVRIEPVFGDAYGNAIRYMLATGTPLKPELDVIMGFRRHFFPR
jgi:hypothetical protein